MSLHLPIGPLITRPGSEPVPRCEASTYKPLAVDIATAPSGPIFKSFTTFNKIVLENVKLFTLKFKTINWLHCSIYSLNNED